MSNDKPNPPLTTEEFAALARCHPKTIRRWITEKRIRATRLNTRKWLIPHSEVARLFEEGANK